MKMLSRLAAVTALVVTAATNVAANAGVSTPALVDGVSLTALAGILAPAQEATSNTGSIISINPRHTIDPRLVIVPHDVVTTCGCVGHLPGNVTLDHIHARPEMSGVATLGTGPARHDPCICRPGDIGLHVTTIK